MSAPTLCPTARWLLAHLAPEDWRESLEGDLTEEQERRSRAGRATGVFWQCGAVIAVGVRLRLEHVPSEVVQRAPLGHRGAADVLWMDLRYAVRGLVADRAYAVMAVLTLALGIGANAAVFNIANWLVYRPLPGAGHASDLVGVQLVNAAGHPTPLSLAEIERFAAMVPALAGVAANDTLSTVNVSVAHRLAERANVEVVSSNYFDVLEAPLEIGRGFTPDEMNAPAMPASVIISDRLRRSDFPIGEDPVGQTLMVNGQNATIVGVTGRDFVGTKLGARIDVWLPVAKAYLAVVAGSSPPTDDIHLRQSFFSTTARLRPGISREIVRQQFAAADAAFAAASPKDARWAKHHFALVNGLDVLNGARAKLVDGFAMLLALSGMLLVLACANVSNAVLARSTSRAHEVATRLAIGASRPAVARLFLVEGALVAALAGLVAIGLAWLTAKALKGVVILPALAAMDIARPDWRVLLWGVGLATIAALGTSLSPIVSLRRADVACALKGMGQARSRRSGVRRALTTAQTALSLVLIVGAALLARSMRARLSINPGFDSSSVLTFSLAPNLLPGQSGFLVQRAIEDRMARVPGVRAASVAFLPPFYNGNEMRLVFHTDARPTDVTLALNPVGRRFFDAVGVSFVAGRDFTAEELGASESIWQGPVVLTESVATRVFGSAAAAVDQTVVNSRKMRQRVVGVIRDTRQRELVDNDSGDIAFVPYRADWRTPWITVVLQSAAPAETMWAPLRRALADVVPDAPMFGAKTADEGIRTEFGDDALLGEIALVFAGLALVVAGAGLFSVLTRTVAERRRELGIRAALGATPAHIAALVTREAVTGLAAGAAIGIITSAWLTRFLASWLFGVSRFDVVSFAIAIVCVMGATLLATVPACRQAMRLGPATTLRE